MAKGKYGVVKNINNNLKRALKQAEMGVNSDGTKYNEFKPRGKQGHQDAWNG